MSTKSAFQIGAVVLLLGLLAYFSDDVTPTPAGVYIVSRLTGGVEFCSQAGCRALQELPSTGQ